MYFGEIDQKQKAGRTLYGVYCRINTFITVHRYIPKGRIPWTGRGILQADLQILAHLLVVSVLLLAAVFRRRIHPPCLSVALVLSVVENPTARIFSEVLRQQLLCRPSYL